MKVKEQYEELFRNHRIDFGDSVFISGQAALRYLIRLEKLGVEIKMEGDFESISFEIPEKNAREVLLYIVTAKPLPVQTEYNIKNNNLRLTWFKNVL